MVSWLKNRRRKSLGLIKALPLLIQEPAEMLLIHPKFSVEAKSPLHSNNEQLLGTCTKDIVILSDALESE